MWSSTTERPEDGSSRSLEDGVLAVGFVTGVDTTGFCAVAVWLGMTESCEDGVTGTLM